MEEVDYSKIGVMVFVLALVGFADISAGAICSFQGVGGLPGDEFYSKAYAISADGKIVVGESYSSLGEPFEAFRWENGVMIGLSSLTDPGDSFFARTAYAVSADGSVIVGQGGSQLRPFGEAFGWEASGGIQGLGGLPPVFAGSRAYGVSADGSVIVGETPTSTDMEAFRWTQAEGIVGLGGRTKAYGVSGDGSVIVGEGLSGRGDCEAFRWAEQEGIVWLGFLEPGEILADSMATAISADGWVIVGRSDGFAFRWEDGVMTDLGAGIGGGAYGVSADGSVVVGEKEPWALVRPGEAFIWDQGHGVRYLIDVLADECGLDLTGWTLERGTGVSADGLTIVGYGTNPDGFTEGWIAAIPEPVTFLLLGFGGLALLGIRNGRG